MTGEIRYSRGSCISDAYPEQKIAPDFASFTEAVLADLSPKKGLAYICAPFSANGADAHHRCQSGVLERRFLGFDYDAGNPDTFALLCVFMSAYSGFMYTTSSHTKETPRARFILELDRPVTRNEGGRLGAAMRALFEAQNGPIALDAGVFRGEQPMFTPTVGSEAKRYSGRPVGVDDCLRHAPTPKKPARPVTNDPYLSLIAAAGLVLEEIEPGKTAVLCPFAAAHTEPLRGTRDSSTVYLSPHYGGYARGTIKCMHAHCASRTQDDYLLALRAKTNGGDTGEVFEEAADEDDTQAEKAPIPAHLLMIPGVLGQAVDYILETAPKPQPVFAVQGALALGALACGRRYRSENDNFTNLWIAIVGPSGSGKEHVQIAIRRLMDTAGLGDPINHGGYTSQGGISSALMEHPNHMSIMDEFGKHMEAICLDHGSTHLKTMMKVLMELYGRSADYYAPQQYSTMGLSEEKAEALKVRIEHPCLTLLATTTPGALYRNLSEQSIEDGFMPRFILRETDVVLRGFRTKLRDTPPPPALIDWIRGVQNQFNGPADHALAPDRIKNVPISADGWAVFEDLENRIVALRNDNKEISELFNRTLENAMRVATIVAASVSAQNPEIDGEVAGWSAEYLLDASLRMLEIAKRFGRDSEWAQSQNKIITFIRKYPDGITQRRLHNSCWAYRNLKPADKKAMIADLLAAGLISTERCSGRGRVSVKIRRL